MKQTFLPLYDGDGDEYDEGHRYVGERPAEAEGQMSVLKLVCQDGHQHEGIGPMAPEPSADGLA